MNVKALKVRFVLVIVAGMVFQKILIEIGQIFHSFVHLGTIQV